MKGHRGGSKESAGEEVVGENRENGEVELEDAGNGGAGPAAAPGTPAAPDADENGVERGETLDDPAQRLAEELEAVNERYLRLAAEFENFRKRTQRERAELSTFAQAELARRLLPTLDDLARVSETPPETTTVEALDAGLDLILRNLRKELQEAGLARIEARGERFDPELHQALMTAATDDPKLDDTVSRVLVDGYVFRDRLVRPAQVEVLTYSPEDDA